MGPVQRSSADFPQNKEGNSLLNFGADRVHY